MKPRAKFFGIAAVAAVFVLLFAWMVCRNFDALTGWLSGDGVAGVRVRDAEWELDGEKHDLRAYRSLWNAGSVFLLDVPSTSTGRERCNLIVGRDYIARFNDGGRSFMVTPLLVIAGETVRTLYRLDDDMKGWGTPYRIGREGDFLIFKIAPAPPHHPSGARLRLPVKFFSERKPAPLLLNAEE